MFQQDAEAKHVDSFSSNSESIRDQVTFKEEQDETTGLDPPCDDDIKTDDSVEPSREDLEKRAEYAESAASEAAGQAMLAGSSFQGESLASSSTLIQVQCGLRPCVESANVAVGREPSVTSSSADPLEQWYGDGGVGTPPIERFEGNHVTTPASEDAKISAAARQQNGDPSLVPTAAGIALTNEEDSCPEDIELYFDFLSHWKWERGLPFNRDYWREAYLEAMKFRRQRNANKRLSLPCP